MNAFLGRAWAPLAILCITLAAYLPTLRYLPFDDDLLILNAAERTLREKGPLRLLTRWNSFSYGRRPVGDLSAAEIDGPVQGYDSRRFRPSGPMFMVVLSRLQPDGFALWRGVCLLLVLLGNLAVFWAMKIWTKSQGLSCLGAALYAISFPRFETFLHLSMAGGVFVGFSALALGEYIVARQAGIVGLKNRRFVLAGALFFLALTSHDAAIHLFPIVLLLECRRTLWTREWKFEVRGILILSAAVLAYMALRAVERPGTQEVFHWPAGLGGWLKATGFLGVRLLYEMYHSRAFDLVQELKSSLRGHVRVELLFLGAAVGGGALNLLLVWRRCLAAGNAYARAATEGFLVSMAGLLVEVLDPNITSGRTYALSALGLQVMWAALALMLLARKQEGIPRVGKAVAAVFVLAHLAVGVTNSVGVVRDFSIRNEALSGVVNESLSMMEESGFAGPVDLTLYYTDLCEFSSHCDWPTYYVGTFEEILRRKSRNPDLRVFLRDSTGSPPRGKALILSYEGKRLTARRIESVGEP